MNVRNAVETVEQTPAQPSPAATVAQIVRQSVSEFARVLPSNVDPERFGRLLVSAVKSTPDLMRCWETRQGRASVLLSAMKCAAVGLEPNTPTQEAWLLPRRNQGTWEAQLYIGYRGFLKLARRSPLVKTVVADVVRTRDHFRWSRGLESDTFEHTPAEGTDEERGELTYAYAIVRYTTGGYAYIVLNRAQVEARRAMSDSWKNPKARPYSPWTKWPEAMWAKSAIRALTPYMDLTPQMSEAMAMDEARFTMDDETDAIEIAEAFGELNSGNDEPVPGGDDDSEDSEPLAEEPAS